MTSNRRHSASVAGRDNAVPIRRLSACGQWALLLCTAPVAFAQTNLGDPEALVAKYENLLLVEPEDCRPGSAAEAAVRDSILPQFEQAVKRVQEFEYEWPGEPAYFTRRAASETPPTDRERQIANANTRLRQLVLRDLPILAYAYTLRGCEGAPNAYYHAAEVLQLYITGLEHAYSRGLTEEAWLPDHAGRVSSDALEAGLTRPSGDFSQLSLRLAGFVQGLFLMRGPLADRGLLDKYRAVARNLAVNNGTMYPAFFQFARKEAGVQYGPLSSQDYYHLNADGLRLFVDSFWPYFLLIDDAGERDQMAVILSRVIATNLAVKPGVQGVIKADGTGFHHAAAYVGGYTSGAFEAAAQLLYLAKQTPYIKPDQVAAVKLALQAYRVMAQKYSVSSALRGRLISGGGLGSTDQIAKALLFLGHLDGMDDFEMRARFHEFFDEERFFASDRSRAFHEGSRSIRIRGLGIYSLVADLQCADFPAAETPTGVWIKPYAASGFFRQGDWLVTSKGFSQYFWDFEGTEDENRFGQNWAYGLLQVFSAGDPISEAGSGYDLASGWDWYHVPGTTASHYPIREWSESALRNTRTRAGIIQRDVHRNYNTKKFVGGVTLGNHGFFVQDLEAVPFTAPTDLRARKSYFFVGDRVLALGTHIRGGTATDRTHTTLFQTRLQDSSTPTWLDGQLLAGLGVDRQVPAGSDAAMIDSVGNSYYLASANVELRVTRRLQSSLTESQEGPTEGAYALAYLDHGIKPRDDRYQYVLIPSDPEGAKLAELEADPDAYYRVLESGSMHVVYFPQHGVTAYAFYEIVETPPGELVRRVDRNAAVIVEQVGDSVRLAASVPDIGWEFDSKIRSQGRAYAARHFRRQEAKVHTLCLVLRGVWAVDPEIEGIESEIVGDETLVRMSASHGLSTEILLSPVVQPPGR